MDKIATLLAELGGLSVIVFALTAWIKQLGVSGKWLTLSAFGVGLVFGLCYRYAAQPMTDFPSWFWAVTFGLMAGALATGAYKGVESATGKNQYVTLELPTKPDTPPAPDLSQRIDAVTQEKA